MQSLTGLDDVHVHLKGLPGLESVRAAGISAVRDAGMRDNAENGRLTCKRSGMPAVVASCWALYKAGGYGSRFGVAAATRSEIKTQLIRLKKAGADIIKVMASGIVSLSNPGRITSGGFDRDELTFIVDEAATSGLSVMAHANSEPAIIAAAGSGVRSIEHGFFMTDAALDLMAAKSVFWCPTIGALVRAAQSAKGSHSSIPELISAHLQKLKRAHELGVPLAVGTDCVLPDASYREAYESELSYFEQAGIARSEVLRIAGEGGARLLGITIAEENRRQ
jgi:imidazolonepropionase-like amidohydrolase